jgi:hypothetical protein
VALPAKINYVDPADASRIAAAGESLPTQAIVTDATGIAVAGATVRWNVLAAGTEGATVAGSVLPATFVTLADGKAHATWTLSATPGENRLAAGGFGIADPRGEASNGPRQGDDYPTIGAFDPFTPIGDEESADDLIITDDDEVAEPIPAGTRLVFSATGCDPIVIDGMEGDDEWGDCATTIPFDANVSGGKVVGELSWARFGGDVYFAVKVPVVTAAEKEIKLTLYLSDLETGATFHALDDVLVVDGRVEEGEEQFSDNYLWDRCPKGKSFCALADRDEDPNDPNEGDGRFSINRPDGEDPFYFFEVRQSENSGSPLGLDIDATSNLGVSLTLRIGKGKWGNTDFPDFGEYETLY